MPEERFMRLAIEKAREGIKKGQTPFGACIIKGNKVISCAHNTVWKDTDITAHAEINAIREACRKLNTVDLSGCIIYSTCEPCPMCFAACHWARMEKVIYGAAIRDAKGFGFNEMRIGNRLMKFLGKSKTGIMKGFMKKECLGLFKTWDKGKDRKVY